MCKNEYEVKMQAMDLMSAAIQAVFISNQPSQIYGGNVL